MTEREELMLYHGICIGTMGSDSEPPDWAKPWILGVVRKYDNAKRTEVSQIVKDEIVAAATKFRGGQN